jgi:hypothetical protein
MDRYTDRQIDRYRWMDGQMDEWINEQEDRYVVTFWAKRCAHSLWLTTLSLNEIF